MEEGWRDGSEVKVPTVQALSLDPQDPQKSPHGHGSPRQTSPSLKVLQGSSRTS